jgi:hypothetical protein
LRPKEVKDLGHQEVATQMYRYLQKVKTPMINKSFYPSTSLRRIRRGGGHPPPCLKKLLRKQESMIGNPKVQIFAEKLGDEEAYISV